MSTGAFSLDQLMELAGLSVSQVGKSSFRVQMRADVLVVPCLTRLIPSLPCAS